MARSRNKYSRARMRARVRRPKKRGGARWYYTALAVIVVVGIVGIVLSAGSAAETHPLILDPTTGTGDHWHAAFDVNICGEWISNPAEFTTQHDNPNVYAGLHTHNDGFVHVEAATRSEAGDNATLGRFLQYGGWSVSENSIDLGQDRQAWAGLSVDPAKRVWTDGDRCPAGSAMAGRKGFFRWSLDCRVQQGDPNAYKIQDGAVIALAFLPKGEAIGVPPNASATPVGESGNALGGFNSKACSTAGPGGTSTTTSSTSAPTATTTTVATTP